MMQDFQPEEGDLIADSLPSGRPEIERASAPVSIIQETSRGEVLMNDKLREHLQEILTLNENEEEAEGVAPTLDYHNEEDREETLIAQKRALASKLEKARLTRRANKSKALVPGYLNNPASLVGCTVLHKCAG
eukprot:GHVO01058477.1.p2 GENE.GHVO01058477.1~~GHVO01058477.1.p2  ORF type:complete len:133 (-),score=15.91 GHVO01058477.1:366-764(-)